MTPLGLVRAAIACALIALGGTAFAQTPPTEGTLDAYGKDMRPLGGCPLKHTDVQVDISGFIARVTLKQEFQNPYTSPIEAVYTFPMSERSAVDSMTMIIGDRVIKGLIKEREAAKQIYEAAKNAGKTASLLDQERPNIFTQSVANIMPGNNIVITISYVEYLKFDDGEYAYSFPMVVGPRYIPGNLTGANPAPAPGNLGEKAGPESTDQVPDAGRVNPPITPEGTRAGHDISLAVNLDAGIALNDVKSELHEVTVEHPSPHRAVIKLADKKEIPNRDFVLTYSVTAKQIEDAVLTHTSAKGGFFTLILQPPDRVAPRQVVPKEMMFVIDCSGSMSGFPIEKAKATMKLAIEQMNPNDTFNLVTFAGGLGYCFEKPMPNTAHNQRKALDYLANLQGGGGTEMMPAIHAALGNQCDPERLRIVCFMTDAYIGNDMAIIDAIQKNVDKAHVFAFGIGNSVNRFLIEGMARAGCGASEIVTLDTCAEEAVERFAERIHSPVLTNISVDFGGLPVESVYPEGIPDLFSAQPLVIMGRYAGKGTGTITLRGQTANGTFERKIPVDLPESNPSHDVLASLWARTAVEDLMYQDWLGMQLNNPDRAMKEKVTKLGLEFGLMTQFTSFVAVEERVVNENGRLTKVEVPVEMPDGVSYEGIFGSEADRIAKLSAGGSRAGVPAVQLNSLGYAGKAVAVAPNRPAAPPVPMTELRKERATSGVRGESVADVSLYQAVPPTEPSKAAEGKRRDLDKKSDSNKLDASLRGLKAKLTDGNYRDENVVVNNSQLTVVIELEDDSEASIAALKQFGVRVKSHTRSSKRVLATVTVDQLEKIAAFDFVKRISPSGK
jgi:Ca-activated chloride channel family protein